MKRLRISHPASAELTEAVRWYEGQRIGLGSEFFDAVTYAIELIRIRPEVGVAAGRTRSWLLTRFPYRLVYRVREEDIYIVAIAHTSRRRWRGEERRDNGHLPAGRRHGDSADPGYEHATDAGTID